MKTLSREEMQKVLIQAKEEQYYEAFLLELCTGLRQGELVALRWDDRKFTIGELRINKQATVVNGQLMITEPKTKAAVRTLILPPTVVRALRERREHISSPWMFPSPKKEGLPIKPQTVRQRLGRILKHTNCKKVRFHDLRHTFATNALEHGMDIKTLSTIIGHVSSAATLNVYAHVTDDMKRQAAAKIDRGIAGVDQQTEVKRPNEEHGMTTFQPRRRWQRKAQ